MTANIPNRIQKAPAQQEIRALMPDFPFDYGKFLDGARTQKKRVFTFGDAAPPIKTVAIVGGGISGIVAGYELLRAGLHPVIFEASDRIGGRMYSKHLDNGSIAELGAMRFPPSCKALFHYFDKVEMTKHMGNFPNPGTPSSPGTLVNYKGKSIYYEKKEDRPQEYRDLEKKWNDLLALPAFGFSRLQAAFSNVDDEANLKTIKDIWNTLVKSHDNVSFHRALVDAGWTFKDIELFGQVGFGSGGWNTNYVNCFLELLRVAYGELETDHKLFYEGVDQLPKRLFSRSPKELADDAHSSNENISLEKATKDFFSKNSIAEIYGNVVHDFEELDNKKLSVFFTSKDGKVHSAEVDAVIYTPHVRVLQMLRDESGTSHHTRDILSDDMWEAVEYTHYMQSSKTFVSVNEPFWEKTNRIGDRHFMSTTLSDRVTRGTYLLNYKDPAAPTNPGKGAICLTYTWNDDALKMLPLKPEERAEIALKALREIYPEADIDVQLHRRKDTGNLDIESILWDADKFYIGAFKNNLPGHYRYQRRLFSHFAEASLNQGKNFFLAGDDISWTGGWSEGAITTGLNAAHAVVKAFGGDAHDKAGPLNKWSDLKPIELV